MPGAHCTSCGELVDASAPIGSVEGPRAGDYSLCVMCGHLMVFDDDMQLRDPTSDELAAIAGDRRLVLATTALHNVHRDIAKKPVK